MADQQQATVGGYYEQINQLTKVVSPAAAESSPPAPVPNTFNLLAPVAITGSIVLGAIAMVVAFKYKQFQRSIAMVTLSLLIAIIPLSTKLSNQASRLSSKAGPDTIPQQVNIKKLTSSSFEITWFTASPAMSTVQLSLDPQMKQLVRSQTEAKATTTHVVLVDLLKPSTTYYFQIYSGSSWYDNGGQPLVITTKPLP